MQYKVEHITFYIKCTAASYSTVSDWVDEQGAKKWFSLLSTKLLNLRLIRALHAVKYLRNLFFRAQFVRYMENVFAYVVSKESLDPSEGIELSGEGVIVEVEKLKAEELKEITKKIKEAQRLAEDLEKEQTVGDDKSEDWVPSKGSAHWLCMHRIGKRPV